MTVNLFQISHDKNAEFIKRLSGETFPAPKNSTFDIVPSGKIGSVLYIWNGAKQPLENRSPWRVGGDAGVLTFKDGVNKLEATVYELGQGKGKVLLKTTWVFNCPKVESPDGIVQKLAYKGIVCYGSDDLQKATDILKDQSATAVRWWNTTNFKGEADSDIATQARAWKAAGVKRIVVTCTLSQNQSYKVDIKSIQGWAASVKSKWAGAIDAVQIINEANLKHFWPLSIQDAADVCQAVWEVIDGSGIEVYAPSISRNTTALKELVATGIGSRVSAFCFHPYGPTADEHINGYKPDPKLKGVKGAAEIVGNHKLVITEFGLHAGSFSGWKVEIVKAWQGIKPYVSEAYCYRLIANAQPAGKFGLMTDKALTTKNADCYATWKGLAV